MINKHLSKCSIIASLLALAGLVLVAAPLALGRMVMWVWKEIFKSALPWPRG